VSKASASVLVEKLEGKTETEAETMAKAFLAMIEWRETPSEPDFA